MQSTWRHRGRRLATAVVFLAGVAAIAATSPAQTRITIPGRDASLRLDQDQPAALTQIVVALNAEATSMYSGPQFQVAIDAVQPVDTPAGGSPGASEPRFIVTSTPPGEAASGERWEEELRAGSPVSLDMRCGIGPCERSFWLIAALDDADAPAVDVAWHVAGELIFSGSAWPTGAGGTIKIEPPAYIEGPIPDLVATTEHDVVLLGPQRPAAARVIEVRIGADAVPDDQALIDEVPFALMSVDLEPRPGSGGEYDRRPLVRVFPLDGAALAANPDGPLPTPIDVAQEANAFSDCEAGVDCVRRFLVTFEWIGKAGEDEAYEWGVRVRRLDLVSAFASPAEMSVSMERRFDVDPSREAGKAHLEGEAIGAASSGTPQVRVELATQTTATDPLLRLLPAPAVMTYRATIIDAEPAPTIRGARGSAVVKIPAYEAGGMASLDADFQGDSLRVVTNPLAGCPPGDACQDLRISVVAQRPTADAELPELRFRWSLDLTLYEFAEAPLELTWVDRSPR